MDSPVKVVPDVSQALQDLSKALFASAEKTGIPKGMLFLTYFRTSQINGDSACVELHSRNALAAGESIERILAVSAWRDTKCFNDAEHAALALCESVTRINDREVPVPDEIFNEAARHYDVAALATLIAGFSTANLWNRFNVATRQIAAFSADK
ncbi:carboxymuconolactone decarboxylase family protein [Paenibacillus filicis]|uniref:Carboxymuconolactone decarboxylase family protein n=1 Tax=Paenibacillus filicis TaxID=669464 RepID=A0ABU9DWD3_9BACL